MDLSEPFANVKEAITRLFRKHKKSFLSLGIFGITAAILSLILYFSPSETRKLQASLFPPEEVDIQSFPIVEPTLRFGFALDTFQVVEGKIGPGDYLGSLLPKYGVDYVDVDQLVKNAKGVFNVKSLQYGKPYTILTRDSTQEQADYFIYQPNVYEYVVFHLKDDLRVERFRKEVVSELKTAAVLIESNLWNAMVDSGLGYEIADKMEDALQWSISFYNLQEGDEFRLVYDQHYIEGEPVGAGRVKAAVYKDINDKEFYSIYYDKEGLEGYYDLEGRPMNKSFLKAPVKFSRISSYYNLNRFHPILKRVRPHLGTDYAAPYGTPIVAVGDGVVTAASYSGGNGNFVKIRHDKTYESQYLHMKGFAKGVKAGVHVKQGEVIGYVGSTGLATGPHVCFRFWKDGRQVNHLKMEFPPPAPLPDEELPAFKANRDSLLLLLNQAVSRDVNTAIEEEEQSDGNTISSL